MTTEKISFSFGKNWQNYLASSFSEERLNIASKHLLEFLQMDNLANQYFLDIGCGSGLHSLAALKAGANKVVSFDNDQSAVQTTERLKTIYGKPQNWQIKHGSILDKNFIATIEPADIVYAWGVLHHTGQMWTAIKNSAQLIKPGGLFYLALYTTTPKSDYWLKLKRLYNRSSRLMKKFIEVYYLLRHWLLPHLLRLKNPVKSIKNYKLKRGMSFYTDVKDWLGGYPYQDAKIEEVLNYCRHELGLEFINLRTGEANTEYLFRK